MNLQFPHFFFKLSLSAQTFFRQRAAWVSSMSFIPFLIGSMCSTCRKPPGLIELLGEGKRSKGAGLHWKMTKGDETLIFSGS